MDEPDGIPLVIIGDGEFAEIAHEYFEHDSSYSVAAFAVEKSYRSRERLGGKPVVDFEGIKEHYPPEQCSVFVAIGFAKLNRVRARLYGAVKEMGYQCARYVSSSSFVWNDVPIGENGFIFEDNTIQPFVEIGNNVILWSGNHIGHRAIIEDHCFISSHVVVSGFCRIGSHTFMGVNSTVADEVSVAEDNWVGPGIVLTKDTEPGQLFGAEHAVPSRVSSYRFFRIKE